MYVHMEKKSSTPLQKKWCPCVAFALVDCQKTFFIVTFIGFAVCTFMKHAMNA